MQQGSGSLDRGFAWVMACSFVVLVSVGQIPSGGDSEFTRAIIAGDKKVSLKFVVVELQGIFQDEGLLIRPPPEPPPRMTLEAGFRFRCQFSLFNFVLLLLNFFDMLNSVVVAFCIVVFNQTLTLGRGDGGFALATLGSFRLIIGQANHIALYKVIGSPTGPRVGGWKYFICHLYPLLNVLLSI
ncbi:unnamed protein product [Cuscuta epithymum]|uniref:Uncharacterized protein n=1 Tax=Cuscuta epithymum TaxID=186058 RepID=A0AAV0CW91_9ASTE|nr:unnamed protein product [Cuscuta epithymum]CAH9148819.1 unnamed protein product [Cuscuta epithymum]